MSLNVKSERDLPTAAPPLSVHPVPGLPEVQPGDDLAGLIAQAAGSHGLALQDDDVVVVAQKIVSKAEDARVWLDTVTPSSFARQWAERWERDPRLVELVLRESRRIVRMDRGIIIAETHHGFICANAGIDLSNTGSDAVAILLPKDPDRSARLLREGLHVHTRQNLAVIISDTFGRPWRRGLIQVAVGVSGLTPVIDLRGLPDADGRTLQATELAVADQLADAAGLVCGKADRMPVAVVRNYAGPRGDGRAAELVRLPEDDLFR